MLIGKRARAHSAHHLCFQISSGVQGADSPLLKSCALLRAPRKSFRRRIGRRRGLFNFPLSMRKQLARLASDADMTMRAFVLNALKEKGLSVREDDLIDLRKERR